MKDIEFVAATPTAPAMASGITVVYAITTLR
jgi:hypothetical protein